MILRTKIVCLIEFSWDDKRKRPLSKKNKEYILRRLAEGFISGPVSTETKRKTHEVNGWWHIATAENNKGET